MSRRRPSEYTYRPAWWVPGAHAQTLWGKFFRRAPRLPVPPRVERVDTPDGDAVELHRMVAPASHDTPHLLLLHGLEGTVRSHYVGGFFAEAQRRGWTADLLVFRGCGHTPNVARRFYHSGETTDLAFVLDRVIAEHPGRPIVLAGVSLGGNVLLKFLGEHGDAVPDAVRGAAAMSVPFDLARGSRHIGQGFARVYERHFLRTLRAKAVAKLARYDDLFDADALNASSTLWDFDDIVTARVHGFRDAADYYSRSSSLHFLSDIRVPTLLLSAYDDPFLPREVLAEAREVAARNSCIEVDFVERGGHVGFVGGRLPWRPEYYGERRVVDFLARRAESRADREPRRPETAA